MERDNFHAGILFIIKNCFYPQKHVFICSKIYIFRDCYGFCKTQKCAIGFNSNQLILKIFSYVPICENLFHSRIWLWCGWLGGWVRKGPNMCWHNIWLVPECFCQSFPPAPGTISSPRIRSMMGNIWFVLGKHLRSGGWVVPMYPPCSYISTPCWRRRSWPQTRRGLPELEAFCRSALSPPSTRPGGYPASLRTWAWSTTSLSWHLISSIISRTVALGPIDRIRVLFMIKLFI